MLIFSLSYIHNNILEEDQHCHDFAVPTEYYPGIDLISKIILTDEQILDNITASLVKAPKGSYYIEPLEFIHKHVFSVLYVPCNLPNNSPPIVINTIETFDDAKFNQIIQQCTNVFELYNIAPICVIIVAQELDESNVEVSS
ncbi:hypothetical protein BD408DRAFT_343365 [Parasitella parasitica]|nr:hypothetical protein BD408DRAFT_343365 [Parasitella parasitica]